MPSAVEITRLGTKAQRAKAARVAPPAEPAEADGSSGDVLEAGELLIGAVVAAALLLF